MKRIVASTLLTSLVVVGSVAAQDEPENFAQDDRRELMMRKLDAAQDLLRALVEEDFAALESGAQELSGLSVEAEWTEALSPTYGRIGVEFRAAADRLADNATERSIDGAAINYVQLVMACVHCHEVVRGEEDIAALPMRDLLERPWD